MTLQNGSQRFHDCFVPYLDATPDLAVDVNLAFVVDSAGHVTSATVTASQHAEVGRCVARAVRALRFLDCSGDCKARTVIKLRRPGGHPKVHWGPYKDQ
jgi:hypothetical protein